MENRRLQLQVEELREECAAAHAASRERAEQAQVSPAPFPPTTTSSCPSISFYIAPASFRFVRFSGVPWPLVGR